MNRAGALLAPPRLDSSHPPNVNLRSSNPYRWLVATFVVTQNLGTIAYAQDAARAPASAPTTQAAPAPTQPAAPTITLAVPPPRIVPVPTATPVASSMSELPTEPAPSLASGVKVHFDANEEEVALMLRREGAPAGHAGYDYVCVAPCDARLLPGQSQMALSLSGHASVDVRGPVGVSSGTTLRGTYRSRATMRTVGMTVLIVGAIAGGIVASGGASDVSQNPGVGWTLVGAGAACGLSAVIAGAIMLSQKDQATIEIMPQTVSHIRALPAFANERGADLPTGQGIELRLRF
jgi:hypothetical protein